MKSHLLSSRTCLSVLMLSIFSGGCSRKDGPDLGQVRGRVTQAGKPIQEGWIAFQPEHGRMSFADVKADGSYELDYGVAGRMGAMIGKHTVRIGRGGRRIDERTDSPRITLYEQKDVTVTSEGNTMDFDIPVNVKLLHP